MIAKYLTDIEAHLQGSVRHSGDHRLRTNWCPCCGHRSKKHKRGFVITEYADGLGAKCFRCDAPFRQLQDALERATGVRIGRVGHEFWITQVGADPGPFHAEEEVLKRLDRNKRISFPPPTFRDGMLDQVGADADMVAGCTWSARIRTKRLQHQPEVSPFAQRFTYRALHRLGRRVTRAHAITVARRINDRSGATDFHYIPEHQVEHKHYHSIAVHNLAVPRTQAPADADASTLPQTALAEIALQASTTKRAGSANGSASSCTAGTESREELEALGAVDRAHSPPSEPEPPPMTTSTTRELIAPAPKEAAMEDERAQTLAMLREFTGKLRARTLERDEARERRRAELTGQVDDRRRAQEQGEERGQTLREFLK